MAELFRISFLMQDQNKLEKLSYRFKRVLLVLKVSQAKNKTKIK